MSVLVQPSPIIRYQFFDSNGDPLAFGKIYTYAAGTNTPAATYTDHTGSVANSNPIILDAGGYADIWLTASSYKISVHDANDVPLYTIDGLPGLGSVISVGNLPPIFTSSLAGGAINFTLSNAAAGTLLGNFTGSAAPPTYGVIGSDTQVTFNKAGKMSASADMTFDDTGKVFTIGSGGVEQVRITGTGSGGRINFGGDPQPLIELATDWFFTALNGQSIDIGQPAEQKCYLFGPTLGQMFIGRSSHNARVSLNDGSSSAGVFAGPDIIAGSVASPNTVISAPVGSIFLTTAGGAGTTLWVKESGGSGNTGWVGK